MVKRSIHERFRQLLDDRLAVGFLACLTPQTDHRLADIVETLKLDGTETTVDELYDKSVGWSKIVDLNVTPRKGICNARLTDTQRTMLDGAFGLMRMQAA